MKVRISCAYLLFLPFFLQVRSDILQVVNGENGNCTFVLSNGDYEEFLEAVPWFEKCTRTRLFDAILEIKLFNYTLPSFPNGAFTNLPHLKSFRLEISKGSKIHLLSPVLPRYFVFKNMKFKTAVLDISDTENLIGWKWEVLSEFETSGIERFEFNVMNSKILRLSSSFGKVANGKLTAIRILKCKLRWIDDHAIKPFSNLKFLELRNNFIEDFKRSHLPQDASKLRYIDLGKNRLRYLPDIFEDLKLEKLFLDGNNIKITSSQMGSILAVENLRVIKGIIWPCDCKLQELLEKFPKISEEKCYTTKNETKALSGFISGSCEI